MAKKQHELEEIRADYAIASRETKRLQEINGVNGGVYKVVVGYFAQQGLQPQGGRIRIHEDEELRNTLSRALEAKELSFGQLINKRGVGIVSAVFKGMAIIPDQILVKMGPAGSKQKTSDISISPKDFMEICEFCAEQQSEGLKQVIRRREKGNLTRPKIEHKKGEQHG